jgi:hypothetical protein
MEEKQKVIYSVIVFAALIIIAAGIYFLWIRDKGPEKMEEEIITEELEPRIESQTEDVSKPPLKPLDVNLGESDPILRDKAAGLSDKSTFADWLATDNIIKKFVAAVDNIAHGLSPRSQIVFFNVEKDFQAEETEKGWEINPESYRRYDPVVEVFLSLDIADSIRLYYQFSQAVQAAYEELGYPNQDFTPILKQAINELLAVPVVSEPIQLEQKMMSYIMEDPELENLSAAQKHFLRMGPENVRKIQAKLKEFQQALNNPDQIYDPENDVRY